MSEFKPPQWLATLLANTCGMPDFSLRVDAKGPQSAATDSAFADDRSIGLGEQATLDLAKSQPWHEQLHDALASRAWNCCFINGLVPHRTLSMALNGVTLLDTAALIAQAMECSSAQKQIAILCPQALLVSNKDSPLRKFLGLHHRVDWIVYLANEYKVFSGVHAAFSWAIVVLTVGTTDPASRLSRKPTRLVDLAEKHVDAWESILADAAQRERGETETSNVKWNGTFDELPWTYSRYSKTHDEVLKDAQSLGQLVPLRELIDDARIGVRATITRDYARKLKDDETLPPDTVYLYSGKDLNVDGVLQRPDRCIDMSALRREDLLRVGDVLIRALVGPSRREAKVTIYATAVRADDLPAAIGNHVIRLRWKEDFPDHVRELLLAFLNSEHASEIWTSRGTTFHLHLNTLLDTLVPLPRADVLSALKRLEDIEQNYRRWVEGVREARQRIFCATRYGEAVRELLERERLEQSRITAGEESQTFEYQVRHSFPHGIAFRYENLRQLSDGKDRFDETLECAEHLVRLLAILAMVQQTPSGSGVERLSPSKALLSAVDKQSLALDWGTARNVLAQGIGYTWKSDSPLSLPIPAMGSPMLGGDWKDSEEILRAWRNDKSHLHRKAEEELREMSAEAMRRLEVMLGGAELFTNTRFVHVIDYFMNAGTGKRWGRFAVLHGISSVFKQESWEMSTEIPRGITGILDRTNKFWSVWPWMVWAPCSKCNRAELFVFGRYSKKNAEFVAVETGHSYASDELSRAIGDLISKDPK